MTPARLAELAPALWRWTARHPEWHPGDFGAEVACFALRAGDDLLLVDPLLPADADGPVLEQLDALADPATTHVLITIGYHVRSAEALCERYGARVFGPKACARRLGDASRLTVLEPGDEGPAGVAAFAIGRPKRGERPLWLPSHRAVAFGDALVGTPDGELRLWEQEPVDDRRARWYRETFAPTLAPLLELGVQRVLVTHGAPVLEDGARALRDAVEAPPWYHRG
jgi:hypothetical protein